MICQFCGTEATLTKEHVIPAWISTLPSFAGKVMVNSRAGDSGKSKTFSLKKIDLQVRIACGDCNGGWMSRLENSVKVFLGPLLEGAPVSLGPERLSILARWCIKTAIAEVNTSGYGAILPTVTARQLADGDAPTNVAVWISRFHDTMYHDRPVRLQPRRLDCTADGVYVGSLVDFTAALGPLVIKVVFVPDAIARGLEALEFDEPKPLIPLWPKPVAELSWPPAFSYCEAELVALNFALAGISLVQRRVDPH